MHTMDWEVVVIGGSVAGLSAAQMLGRARRRTLVIDAGAPRNRFAAHMHGVLGLDGTPPAELIARGRAEVESYGVTLRQGSVAEVSEIENGLAVRLADGASVTTRAVVIASGVVDHLPDISGLHDRWGRDLLHCPYCHGFEVAGRRLGVIATSPMSVHQIEMIRQWSDDVTAFTALLGPVDEATLARFMARGIRIVDSPVVSIETTDDALTAIVTDDGERHAIDAAFTAPTPQLDLSYAASLDLVRTDLPGNPLAVEMTGATSHPRVWAAGNVVAPFGNVPLAMGSGSMAGAGANAGLITEDTAAAVAARQAERNAGWESRYAENDRFWSGKVNATLADVVEDFPRGTALDVGSGEGGDASWLASQGWTVTGVDVSATAVKRATDAAREHGLDASRVQFVAMDAVASLPEETFDLVTSSFLHSWEADFPRLRVLRSASERVAPGGRLVVISHAAPPSWARELPAHMPVMRTPDEELALLALPDDEWTAEVVEIRTRAVTDAEGNPAHLDDGVLVLRRKG